MKPSTPQNTKDIILKGQAVFEFNVGDHSLVATGTMATGKEEIYLDGELVSEKRTQKKSSFHLVEIEGKGYEIKFLMSSYFLGKLKCQLWSGDILIKSYRLKSHQNSLAFFGLLVSLILLSGLMGFFQVKLSLPEEIKYLNLVLLLVFIYLNSKFIRYSAIDDPNI